MSSRKILSVFLFLVWGALFSSVCAAAPLMVEKNLFSMDRKPPQSDSADTSGGPSRPGMGIGNIQLDGVIIRDNTKSAILRLKNRQLRRPTRKGEFVSPFIAVHEGEMVGDYRVMKIESKSILLEKEGQTYRIGLFAENKVVTPPSPTPVAPARVPPRRQKSAPGAKPLPPGTNRPPAVQPRPGYNPRNQPAALERRMPPRAPSPNPGAARLPGYNGNIRRNVYAPVPRPAINRDANQPAQALDEEE